jgi:tetratricopeptide (TPR) repeat protein
MLGPMWITPKEDEVRARHDEALALLENGDLNGARRIAEELRALRWSGAFEVLALAARAEKDLEGAVRVLDEGCALAPAAWALYELRGTMLDGLGRSEEALASYDHALGCEGVWAASVRYNRAIARLRLGDAGGALADAEAVMSGATPPPFLIDAVQLAVDALDRLGRKDDAVSLVRTALAEADEAAAARLRGVLAVALARAGQMDAAREAARIAIEAGHGNAALARLMPPIRDDGRPARWLRLVVQGRMPVSDRSYGFLRVLSVLAADANEALAWAAELEPVAWREALQIDECKDNDAPPPEGAARGVVGATGRVLFDET